MAICGFLDDDHFNDVLDPMKISYLYSWIEQKLMKNWELEFDIKVPFLVITDNGKNVE